MAGFKSWIFCVSILQGWQWQSIAVTAPASVLFTLGYEVGRFISLERLIEEKKIDITRILELSSTSLDEGKHDPWPYINFVLYILKSAYKEFEQRVGDFKKRQRELRLILLRWLSEIHRWIYIDAAWKRFCPGSVVTWFEKVLRNLQKENVVECIRTRPPEPNGRKRVIPLKEGNNKVMLTIKGVTMPCI